MQFYFSCLSPQLKVISDSGRINIYWTSRGSFSSPSFCFCVSVVFKVWDNISNCKDLNFKLRSHDSFISWRLIEFMFLLLSCHRRRTSFTWESLFPSNVKIKSASGVNSLHLHRLLHAMRFNRKLTRNVCFQFFFFSRKKKLCLKS